MSNKSGELNFGVVESPSANITEKEESDKPRKEGIVSQLERIDDAYGSQRTIKSPDLVKEVQDQKRDTNFEGRPMSEINESEKKMFRKLDDVEAPLSDGELDFMIDDQMHSRMKEHSTEVGKSTVFKKHQTRTKHRSVVVMG